MNLQLFLIFFVLTVINLCSANCIKNQFQKSALPSEMPENTTMEYSSGCGYVSSCYIIVISGNQLRFEEKISEPQAENLIVSSTWLAQISVEEKAKLYRAFVDNSFDLIENEETLDITLDAVSEGVEIRAGTFHKHISYGENHPLSRNNLSRYRAVADSIKELVEKYQTDCTGELTVNGTKYNGTDKNPASAKRNTCSKYCIEGDSQMDAMYRIWLDSLSQRERKRVRKGVKGKWDAVYKSERIKKYVVTCEQKCLRERTVSVKCDK